MLDTQREYDELIYEQSARDKLFREVVVTLSREMYSQMIRDAGSRIVPSDMLRTADTCIEAAKVFATQVRDTV